MHLTQTKLKNLRKVINTQNYEGTFRYTMADAALACKAAGCLFEYERLVCMAGQARGTTPTTTSQSGIAIDDTETSDPLLREKKTQCQSARVSLLEDLTGESMSASGVTSQRIQRTSDENIKSKKQWAKERRIVSTWVLALGSTSEKFTVLKKQLDTKSHRNSSHGCQHWHWAKQTHCATKTRS